MTHLRLGDDRLQLMREILQNHDDHSTGIRELLFEFTRRVQRIEVDDCEARAQRAEEGHRIGQHVRQHQSDAVARPGTSPLRVGMPRNRGCRAPIRHRSSARLSIRMRDVRHSPGRLRVAARAAKDRRRRQCWPARPPDMRIARRASAAAAAAGARAVSACNFMAGCPCGAIRLSSCRGECPTTYTPAA